MSFLHFIRQIRVGRNSRRVVGNSLIAGALFLSIAVTARTSSAAIIVVANNNDTGAGSLRQAILDSNASVGVVDTINFNIAGAGVHTIRPASNMIITDPVIIDGYSQPGAMANTLASGDNAVLLIELNGQDSDPNLGFGDGLVITAGNSTVRGLIINGFRRAGGGGGGRAIRLQMGGSNIIEGNFLGTDASGTMAIGNGEEGVLADSSSNNRIGGTTAAARNLISGHASLGLGAGIRFVAPSSNNIVQGNFIGTDRNGVAALSNYDGVVLDQSPNNTIGGTVPGAGNLISSQNDAGVQILSGTNNNTVQGNLIGVDITGMNPLPNTFGVQITNAFGNVIGRGAFGAPDDVIGARNIISGNSQGGVQLAYGIAVAQQNFVRGNFIGTDVTGTNAVGNGVGVHISGEPGTNVIGGATAGAGNVISGNTEGIRLDVGNLTPTVIQGNLIGTRADGVSALGNLSHGIISTNDNIAIGGSAPGEGNTIAFNGGAGVVVTSCCGGAVGMGNTILSNSIYSNAGLGIDLGGNGVTANDPGDSDTGPNNLQNYPVLTSVSSGGGMTSIAGTLNSVANLTYRVEFFANNAIDSSGYGEGQTFIGSTNVTTDANGNASFNLSVAQIAGIQRVTATATDPNGNTSEFSAAIGQLLNVSTRLPVQTGDNVLIGGFIITGTEAKKVIVRGIGPSLSGTVEGFLADPTLELHDTTGTLASNDNWRDTQQAEIEATGIAPSNDLESAIVRTVPANNSAYTVIVRGKNDTTGIGVVEAYDLDQAANSKLANISTRGFVESGNNVLIGGIIVGNGVTKVVVRAIGPTLAGVSNSLQDPTLELHDGSGATIATNDNWRATQEAEIIATGIAPTDDRESAIVAALNPGPYTAIVRGAGNTTGVGLVEAYNIQ